MKMKLLRWLKEFFFIWPCACKTRDCFDPCMERVDRRGTICEFCRKDCTQP